MNSGSVSSATNCFPPRQIYTGKVTEEFCIQKPKVPKAMTTGMRSNLQRTAIRGRKWQKPAIPVQLICVMTDTKSKRQLALSSNSPFIRLPWMCIIYFLLLTMYLSIHLHFPPLHPSLPTLCAAVQLQERGQWWREQWRNGGRPRGGKGLIITETEWELRASICPIAIQVVQIEIGKQRDCCSYHPLSLVSSDPLTLICTLIRNTHTHILPPCINYFTLSTTAAVYYKQK